jgi:hypothetical protein
MSIASPPWEKSAKLSTESTGMSVYIPIYHIDTGKGGAKMTIKQIIHITRLVLSFALLGALIAGAFFGGSEFDLRPYGAALGGSAAAIYKLLHIL